MRLHITAFYTNMGGLYMAAHMQRMIDAMKLVFYISHSAPGAPLQIIIFTRKKGLTLGSHLNY